MYDRSFGITYSVNGHQAAEVKHPGVPATKAHHMQLGPYRDGRDALLSSMRGSTVSCTKSNLPNTHYPFARFCYYGDNVNRVSLRLIIGS